MFKRCSAVLLVAGVLLGFQLGGSASANGESPPPPPGPKVVQKLSPALLGQFLQASGNVSAGLREEILKQASVQWLRSNAGEVGYNMPDGEVDPAKLIDFPVMGADGNQRQGWISLPPGYDGTKPMALMLNLHGGVSGVPAQMVRASFQEDAAGIPVEVRQDVILMAIAAECDRFGMSHMWWRPDGQRLILNAVVAAKKAYNIDDARVFVTGMSDGGSGCYGLACKSPDTFAGYFPMVGHPLVPSSDGGNVWLHNFNGNRIYNISGGKDRLYPGEMVRETVNEINAHSNNAIIFKLYPEAGHDLSYIDQELPVLAQYMAEWRRDVVPATIDWTVEATSIDGGEAGFGNRRAWIAINTVGKPHRNEEGSLVYLSALHAEKPVRMGGTWRARLGISLGEAAGPVVGVLVGDVAEESVAEAIGLKGGDLITQINDTATPTPEALRAALAECKPHTELKLTITREGKPQVLEGKWDGPAPEPAAGRVTATLRPGEIEIKTIYVDQFTVFTGPAMLSEAGQLRVTINGKLMFSGTPPSDAAFLLDEYGRTADRSMAYCGRLVFKVPTDDK